MAGTLRLCSAAPCSAVAARTKPSSLVPCAAQQHRRRRVEQSVARCSATQEADNTATQTCALSRPQNPWIPHRGAAVGLAVLAATATCPDAAHALQMEPANALSLPTWAIHVSSVAEWAIAMGLMWRYAEACGNPLWKGMTWAMVPALGSATCACTWHFFYNSPDLEFLVALQAFLTCVSNTTCAWAAFRIWQAAKAEAKA